MSLGWKITFVLMWCKTNSTKSYEKKKNLTVYCHAFSSKANFESPLKTYLVIDNVEDVIVK